MVSHHYLTDHGLASHPSPVNEHTIFITYKKGWLTDWLASPLVCVHSASVLLPLLAHVSGTSQSRLSCLCKGREWKRGGEVM